MRVQLDNLVMDFPGSRALDHVSADFGFDEVHGLIGENGAGKSTLVNILGGSLAPTAGTVSIGGKPVTCRTPRDALEQGIAHVSQEGSLVPGLTGAENILLGEEPRRAGVISRRDLMARAQALLTEWFPQVRIALDRPVEDLDIADRKVIEIVRGLRGDIRLLILDEPTATLQSREKAQLWDIIRSLPGRGVGVVLISHFLSEIRALSDRITVLRDGVHVATLPADSATEGALVDLMLRRTGSGAGLGMRRDIPHPGAPVLSVRDWQAGGVQVPDFTLRAGEIVGLIGLTGAGHFGFARSLYTQAGLVGGRMQVGATDVTDRGPRAMQRHGIGFVPDNRMTYALSGEGSIVENLSMVHPECAKILPGGILSRRRETQEGARIFDLLGIRASGQGQQVKTLSGGNKQKVSLGKWLYGAAGRYRAMIFVEPTEGVDIGAKQEIYGHIRKLAAEGAGIIVASSDLLEIEHLAHRVVPFVAGQAGNDIAAAEFSEARFIAAMAGETTQ